MRVSNVLTIAILHAGCSGASLPEVESTQRSNSPTLIVEPAISELTRSTSAVASSLPGIVRWEKVPPLTHDVAIMESVFWEPADTISLRQMIFNTPSIKGSRVLEIGSGSGLLSVCCLQAGADRVVATDLNLNAVQNVRFNAVNFGSESRLEARLVPRRDPDAWTVIRADERFDFIISNPPWEDNAPKSVAEFALYDPNFLLLDSLVTGASKRLTPGGRMWLAYGCVTAVRRIEMLAKQERLQYLQKDARSIDELPEVFLPGMVLELTVPSTETEFRDRQDSE